jgi:hypothetical protein
MGAETSKPAGAVIFGVEALTAAAGAAAGALCPVIGA